MSKAEKLARFNLILTFVWVALTFPSLLFWSKSILWVIVISLWANIVGHFSAYLAAHSEAAQEKGYNLTEMDKAWLTHQIQLLSASTQPSTTQLLTTTTLLNPTPPPTPTQTISYTPSWYTTTFPRPVTMETTDIANTTQD